ncbi:MAG: hypothetical protein NZZ60_03005 [Bacteroidia bacterium]|nr:hypothetical protein [Bacteroidia bacterium]MCX7652018.1 hypothetical protein [Bacteroidia bacterium]MDW8416311.1 hypothetical protein [Bacteroidia bacterium]
MRKIALTLVPLLGVMLAKAETAEVVVKSQAVEVTEISEGPGKNYRAQIARAYFGGGGSKCRNWKRFCGR